MANPLRELWSDSGAATPAPRVWRDWVFLAAVLSAMLVEGLLRPNLLWRPVVIPMAMAMAFSVLWRRTHPLASVSVVLVGFNLIGVAIYLTQDSTLDFYSSIFVLVLIYSLFRWGTGREAAIGSVVMLGALVVGAVKPVAAHRLYVDQIVIWVTIK